MIELLTTCTAIDIMLEAPRLCMRCRRLAHWFRNQDGRTCCIYCVLDLEEARRGTEKA